MLISTVVLFLAIDLTTANVVEPRVYGSSTGVSPIAILLSAMFWATLWGPIGLILATPMTVCLVVIGRYIPQFQVLETLLGSEPVLEPPERLYQRMLKGNVEEAIEISEEIVETSGLEAFQENVLLPALRLASNELSDTPEALAQRRVLATSIDAVIDELGQAEALDGTAVVLIGGRTEIDESAARVVAQRLAARGTGSRVLPAMAVRQESIGRVDIDGAEVVCLFYFGTDIKAQTRYVSRRLKFLRPGLKVIVCHLAAEGATASPEALRVDSATHGFEDTLDEIDSHIDVVSAAAKLAGHQPFLGAGRGDDELGRALKAIAEAMAVPLATVNLLADERHRDDEGAYKLTEIIAERKLPLVIPPGIEGEVLSDNPYLQANGVDFYAGVPLTLDSGVTVGSLVILDYQEHPFSEEDLARLQQMAADLVERFGNAPPAVSGA
jgi:GAF domain-containing protein